MQRGKDYDLYFTEEDTEDQRSWVVCPRLHSQQVPKPGLEAKYICPIPAFSTLAHYTKERGRRVWLIAQWVEKSTLISEEREKVVPRAVTIWVGRTKGVSISRNRNGGKTCDISGWSRQGKIQVQVVHVGEDSRKHLG